MTRSYWGKTISSGIWAMFNAVRGVPRSVLLPAWQPLGGREGEPLLAHPTEGVARVSSLVCSSAEGLDCQVSSWACQLCWKVKFSHGLGSRDRVVWTRRSEWVQSPGRALGSWLLKSSRVKGLKSEFCRLHMAECELKPALMLLRTPLLGPVPCCGV